MQNLNEHINTNNSGTVDYWQASIASAYDYSPFGVMLTGRTFEGKQTICHDSTTLITQKTLEEGFSSWGSWTTMGSALLTYVSGEMQVSNPNSSKKNIGASKAFTTGTGVHNVSFEVIGNTCATVVIWPPSSTPIPINVSVKDNYGNVVASGNYTTAGTYNLSFTPASASATYTLEFHMTNASAFCFFRVDDVLVSYDDTTKVTVCKEVEDGYRYGFNSMEKDDQVKGRGNSYDFGARMLDPRLGRWLTIDPLAGKYKSMSPYSAFGNNPIYIIDPDGRLLEPQPSFISSPFGPLYQNLLDKNSTFNKILSRFKGNSDFNFRLFYGEEDKITDGATATTYSAQKINTQKLNGKAISTNVVGVESNSYYGEKTAKSEDFGEHTFTIITFERTEIAMVKTLIHEAIHAQISTTSKKDDKNHNSFSKHQKVILEGLKEYNIDNDLGYKDEQLIQLSWEGMEKSSGFKDYINGKVVEKGTSYEEEFSNWQQSVSSIVWKEKSREVIDIPPPQENNSQK